MGNIINLGIIGPGNIASIVAKELDKVEELNKYAVASRSLNKAQKFCEKFGFEKPYNSYEKLLKDDNVDLVYIATPHAFHFEQMMLALKYKKNIICEKAFTLNKKDAEIILNKARKDHIFVTEALITAYLPTINDIKDLIDSKVIGQITAYKGVFGNYLMDVERVIKKGLGGGALYDIGIYPLYFCLSLFGFDPQITDVNMKMFNDIDESEVITLNYKNGIKAEIHASIRDELGYYCDIIGTKGRIHIEAFGMPKAVEIYDVNNNLIRKLKYQDNGYKYEFQACVNAINKQRLETKEMPHQDTLMILEYIDNIYAFNKHKN